MNLKAFSENSQFVFNFNRIGKKPHTFLKLKIIQSNRLRLA